MIEKAQALLAEWRKLSTLYEEGYEIDARKLYNLAHDILVELKRANVEPRAFFPDSIEYAMLQSHLFEFEDS